MKCVEKWFDNMCEWRKGNGERIRFWQDTLGDQPLEKSFPRLFLNWLQKQVTLSEMGSRREMSGDGNLYGGRLGSLGRKSM